MLREEDCVFDYSDKSVICKGVKIFLTSEQVMGMYFSSTHESLEMLDNMYMRMLPQIRNNRINKILD